VSTAASFFANVVSSLPVIKEFGIFMGLVVVVNFTIIVIYFPTLVIIADKICGCCKPSSTHKSIVVNRHSLGEDGMLVSPRDRLSVGSAEDENRPFVMENPSPSQGAGMASAAVPVAQMSSGNMGSGAYFSPVIMEATAAPLTSANRVTDLKPTDKKGVTVARIGGGGGKPMLSALKQASPHTGSVKSSVRNFFGLSSKDNAGAHYGRESFSIKSADGWGIVDR